MAFLDTYVGGQRADFASMTDAQRMSAISTYMTSVCGCTVYDTISTTDIVFSFVAFTNAPPVFIRFTISSGALYEKVSLGWNLSTHAAVQSQTGLRGISNGCTLSNGVYVSAGPGFFLITGVSGSTNGGVSSSNWEMGFVLGERLYGSDAGTVTTAAVATGTSVVVPVSSVDGFSVSQIVVLAGAVNTTEGRSFTTITAIDSYNKTITLANVVQAVASGAYLATVPHVFSIDGNGGICPFFFSGWTACTDYVYSSGTYGSFVSAPSSSLVDVETGRRFCGPVISYSASLFSARIPVGACVGSNVSMSNGDSIGFTSTGSVVTGTATGGSTSTLIDTSRTFDSSYIGKMCSVSSGAGVGQSRRIVGADGNTLTFNNVVLVAFAVGSVYNIVDTVYRYYSNPNSLCFRETM